MNKEKEQAFLKEYRELCDKYEMEIDQWKVDMYRVAERSEGGHSLDIYTSDDIEEMNRIRAENEIKRKKEYWAKMGGETDEFGEPTGRKKAWTD